MPCSSRTSPTRRGAASGGASLPANQQAAFDGLSPIAIAKALNRDGISGPGGNAWRDTTIRGHAERGTGILRNELYIGRLIWNRMRFVKDPGTDKRISRMNDRASWVIEEVPHLRIVGQDLWDRVQHRLGGIREASGANDPDRPRYWENRRAHHLLTGKTFCATCGGTMTNVGRDYLACGAARKGRGCIRISPRSTGSASRCCRRRSRATMRRTRGT